jgi:hypothetical protein
LQSAHPSAAKFHATIRISPIYGSAMILSFRPAVIASLCVPVLLSGSG